MKKKQKPTASQFCSMTTQLMAAYIRSGQPMTIDQVIEKVDYALSKIYEIINERAEADDIILDDDDEIVDYFAEYPWTDEPVRYTELDIWLRNKLGTKSNRRISKIFKDCYQAGYIIKDPQTKKYFHHSLP